VVSVRTLIGLLLAVAIPGVPAAYASHRLTCWRHFRVVEEGRLYRSGQLAPDVLDRVIHDRGIRTVVCLRSLARDGDPAPENAEELWCAGRGIRYVRLNPVAWDSPAGRANLDAFLGAVDGPADGPVLVHCFAGLHRTGAMCAVFRMECQGWDAERAIAEMYDCGFAADAGHGAIEDYLRAYRPGRTDRRG